MICAQRIHTQLLLENLEVKAEADRVRRGRKPQYDATALSVEDQERVLKLIQERDRLPSGPKSKKQRISISCRIWRIRHPDKKPDKQKRRQAQQKWLRNNQSLRKQVALNYYYRNRPQPKQRRYVQTRSAQYIRTRRIKDVQFALGGRMRATMNRAFRRNWIKKPARTEELLGCTIEEAKAHIENQFTEEMSWNNRMSFVIDHVIPVSAFDLRDQEEAMLAFNWKNLQPLTPHENATKQASVPSPLPDWIPSHIAARIIERASCKC